MEPARVPLRRPGGQRRQPQDRRDHRIGRGQGRRQRGTVTESNTQATLEYLLNNYRAQLDARGKTKVKTMLRSNDSYIQAIAPTAIPSIVEREQFHDYVMADWRYRVEDASGKSSYGPFVGGAAQNAADIRADFGRLPTGFKTPPYPGSLYFWEIGKYWTLPFVTGKARVVMAVGKTEAQLYEDIGFGAVTPPIDPPPPPPVIDPDLSALQAQVDALIVRVDSNERALGQLQAFVDKVKAAFAALL